MTTTQHRVTRVACAVVLAAVTAFDVRVGHTATAIVCGAIFAVWVVIVIATWRAP